MIRTSTSRVGHHYRVNRAFKLQGLLILIAAISGVYLANTVIDEILIKNAIEEEQAYFWDNYQNNPDFPLSDTQNLSVYLDKSRLPAYIREKLDDRIGYFEFGQGNDRVVLKVSSRNNRYLYLLYYRGQVDALILYFGIVPLLFVLVVLYLTIWLIYRYSRRQVSPYLKLAHQIDQIDLSNPDFSSLKSDTDNFDAENEMQILSDAIISLGERQLEFIERERNFTRDASHELRSPLTVINIAVDGLLDDYKITAPAKASVKKIQNAARDINKLVEIFLLLAREDKQNLEKENVSINEVVENEVSKAEFLLKGKDIKIDFRPAYELCVWGSEVVLSVLIGNLLRNAILYTEAGTISIELIGKSLVIGDSGSGIDDKEISSIFEPYHRGQSDAIGYGIGLTIVKRLSNRFNWPIDVQSKSGQGTIVTINFLNENDSA